MAGTVSVLNTVALYAALHAETEFFRELEGRVYPLYGLTVDRTAGHTTQDAIDHAWTSRGL